MCLDVSRTKVWIEYTFNRSTYSMISWNSWLDSDLIWTVIWQCLYTLTTQVFISTWPVAIKQAVCPIGTVVTRLPSEQEMCRSRPIGFIALFRSNKSKKIPRSVYSSMPFLYVSSFLLEDCSKKLWPPYFSRLFRILEKFCKISIENQRPLL